MEVPNRGKRWDNPLFHLRTEEEIPFEEIYSALMDTGKNKPKDPVSTKPEETFDANFIFELDKACSECITFIINKQQEFGLGDSITIPNAKLKYRIYKIMSPVELKKIKKEFLNLCKLKPPKSKDAFTDAFLEFLNTTLERD